MSTLLVELKIYESEATNSDRKKGARQNEEKDVKSIQVYMIDA